MSRSVIASRPRLSFAEELELGETRLPSSFGAHAGMTLDDVARRPKGLAMLRFVSRGSFADPLLNAIRAYLRTVDTAGSTLDALQKTSPGTEGTAERNHPDSPPSAARVDSEGRSAPQEPADTKNAAYRASVGEKGNE